MLAGNFNTSKKHHMHIHSIVTDKGNGGQPACPGEATEIAEDVGVKLEPLSLTVIHPVGRGNKMYARKKELELGSVHAQSEAMKDVFARCHKKTAVQVCTLTIMHYCSVTVNIDVMIACPSF
jgi:hypothetical protein